MGAVLNFLYDQEGASSYVLPPERDQFSRPGLESIDEVEATEVSDNEPQEEEAESTKSIRTHLVNSHQNFSPIRFNTILFLHKLHETKGFNELELASL